MQRAQNTMQFIIRQLISGSTKRPLVPSGGGTRLLCNRAYIGTGPNQFCETSAKIIN